MVQLRIKQMRWLAFASISLLVLLVGLSARLFQLQVLQHEELRAQVERQTRQVMVLNPKRGEIRDTRGTVLATSLPVKTIIANPHLIGTNYLLVARALAPLLQTNETWLADRIMPRMRQVEEVFTNLVDGTNYLVKTNVSKPLQYVVLKHKVSMDTWLAITQAMSKLTPDWAKVGKLNSAQRTALGGLRLRSVGGLDDQIRFYPNHAIAAHVLGYVGVVETNTTMGKVIEMTGSGGIEAKFNGVLSGTRGWRETETDRSRRELVLYRERDVPARNGMNVVLTLDTRMQDVLEGAIGEAWRDLSPQVAGIAAVMMRPKTGQILAMASLPNFDPNLPLMDLESQRNRVIAFNAEPGSTFKVVTVSAALNEKVVDLKDTFFCELGKFSFAKHTLHDHGHYGNMTVEQIITKSSNIGAAKIGIKLGNEKLYEYIKAFGFGEKTGLPLMGEERGIVHSPKSAGWTAVTIAQIPMGQGISVTPIQMAAAICTIANGGKLMKPMLVQRIEDEQGRIVEEYHPQMVRQVISESAAHDMIQAMQTVITKEGTAVRAKLDNYTVAGKTGTAQKPNPAGGYYSDRYFSSFIGYLPAEDPEVCIGIWVDDPPKSQHFGGDAAAPYFKKVADKAAAYLNLRPSPATVGERAQTAMQSERKPTVRGTTLVNFSAND